MISAMRMNDEWYLRSDKAGCGESGAGRAARGVGAHHLDLRRWSGVVLVTSMSASLASPSLLDTDAYGCTEVGGGCAVPILLARSVCTSSYSWAACTRPASQCAKLGVCTEGETRNLLAKCLPYLPYLLNK